VIPHGIPCNDAAGEIIAVGDAVKGFKIGERVAPIVDTKNLTGRAKERSWLAADEDGVLAEYVVFDESVVVRLPGLFELEGGVFGSLCGGYGLDGVAGGWCWEGCLDSR
jgi:NADPH:quinone reductase-like Zn-dependent oxidoreductase